MGCPTGDERIEASDMRKEQLSALLKLAADTKRQYDEQITYLRSIVSGSQLPPFTISDEFKAKVQAALDTPPQ